MAVIIKAFAQWDPFRDEIFNLYYDEGWTLAKIRGHMKNRHGLEATQRQWKYLLKKSGRSKNLSASLWSYISSVVQKRQAMQKGTQVSIDGKIVSAERLEVEIRRYSRYNNTDATSEHLARLQIRTPPPMARDANASDTAWASLNEDDDVRSLDVPSEALSEYDYGSMKVLQHELLIHGIPFPGRRGIITLDFETLQPSPLSSMGRNVPKGPTHCWSWEALRSILGSEELIAHRSRAIPGLPATADDLDYFSEMDLMNLAMNIIINNSTFLLTYDDHHLLSWFLNQRNHCILQAIFDSKNERLVPFVFKFLIAIGYRPENMRRKLKEPSSATILHTFRLAFQIIEKYFGEDFAWLDVSLLLRSIVSLEIPEIAQLLLEISPCRDFEILIAAFEAEKWKMVILLLNNGFTLYDLYKVEEGQIRREGPKQFRTFARRLKTLLPQLLIREDDMGVFDEITPYTAPFTFAEVHSLFSSKFARDVLPWILDPLSREICKWRSDLPLGKNVRVSAIQELYLLMAVRFRQQHITIRLLNLGTHPNCPILNNELQRKDALGELLAQCIGNRQTKYKYPEDLPNPESLFPKWESDDLEFFYFPDWDTFEPICWSLYNKDETIVLLLLEAKACISQTALDFFFAEAWKYKSFLAELIPALMRPELMKAFAGRHRLGLAILSEDIKFLADAINQSSKMNDALVIPHRNTLTTGFTYALMHCGMPTVTFLWNNGYQFIAHPEYPGAYEIRMFCAEAPSMQILDMPEKLNYLVEQRACLNSPCSTEGPLIWKYTPLQLILGAHNANTEWYHPWLEQTTELEIIHLLVSNGADVNSSPSAGPTPLQLAIQKGYFEIFEVTKNGHYDIVKYLVDAGADINDFCSESDDLCGYPPITLACHVGSMDTVKLLVERGVDVNIAPGDIDLPLTNACRSENTNNRLPMVKFLLERGADINSQSGERTALQAACLSDQFDLVLLLLESGADVDAPGWMTAIEIAVDRGKFDIVKLLVNAGAENDVTENRFGRAIQLAGSNLHIVNYLEKLKDMPKVL